MVAQQVYSDFGSFHQMRADARRADPGAARATAQQFESIFIQIMLKAMRAATPEGGLLASSEMDTYEQMFDDQIALDLSAGKGIGLADVIEAQISTAEPVAKVDPFALPLRNQLLNPANRAPLHAPARDREPQAATSAQVAEHTAGDVKRSDWRPHAPEQFVIDVRRFAQKAGGELGVAPEALIAQAALESGWGRHVMRRPDGTSSFNLFGIKASADWTGERVSVGTLEYRNGVAVRERAEFRAYPSLQAAFNDYVDFLKSNPRYTAALSGNGNGVRYARDLQAAGYATDPRYAQKITAIMAQVDAQMAALPARAVLSPEVGTL